MRELVRADLLPVLAIAAYFILGFVAYVVRCAIKGVPHDHDMETRTQSQLLTVNLRLYFVWVVSPLWRLLLVSRLGADGVTATAAIVGGVAALAVAAGHFALGGWLFIGSGILDALDGRLARFQNRVTTAGAAFDSILDRYVDFAMLAGLAWYYRDSWVLGFVLLALLGTSLVPYVRAKGEALHVPIVNGLMQRPERLFLLGGTVALSPIVEALGERASRPMNWLAVAGIAIVAVTTNLTAVTRFRTLLRALRASMPAHAAPARPPAQRRLIAHVTRAPKWQRESRLLDDKA
jgi:phosphatidylglycerophosphate synthase